MSDVHMLPDLTQKRPTKRVIIAGSRKYRGGIEGVTAAVKASGFDIEVVLYGGATGADRAGKWWAEMNDCAVETFEVTPRDWKKYGKGAGMRRNAMMAKHADALIALWDGASPGTRDMIERMHERDKPVCIYWEGRWSTEQE